MATKYGVRLQKKSVYMSNGIASDRRRNKFRRKKERKKMSVMAVASKNEFISNNQFENDRIQRENNGKLA